MTPDPATTAAVMDSSVPWVTIIGVAVPAFAAFGSILVFFVKRLLRATGEVQDLKMTNLQKGLDSFTAQIAQTASGHERLRDKWDEFLREYLKIDSTRGQKIDALFRIVDQMQEALREIKPVLNAKIEDVFSRAISELKVYVRDQIREERNVDRGQHQ